MANFRAPGGFFKAGRFSVKSVWPFRRALVQGDSMAPTFRDGDHILVKMFSSVELDLPLLSVVLIEREAQPGIFYVKRIQKAHSGAYWVEGDNRDPEIQERMSDSRTWGYVQAHEIRGRVLLKIGSVRKRAKEKKK